MDSSPHSGPCTKEQIASGCAMGTLLETLTRPWTLHIIFLLERNGPTRFGALRRAVEGISARVLTERLRTLEDKGFVFRDYKPTIPPEVTYGLTDRAHQFGTVMCELSRLAQLWQQEDLDNKKQSAA